jgi:hypothetical protein
MRPLALTTTDNVEGVGIVDRSLEEQARGSLEML